MKIAPIESSTKHNNQEDLYIEPCSNCFIHKPEEKLDENERGAN